EQVNTALSQMDEVTQQNSALVEENAATAKTLEQQSTAMNERVGAFRLDNVSAIARAARAVPAAKPQVAAAARRPAAKPHTVAAKRPAGRAQAAAAVAQNEFEEF